MSRTKPESDQSARWGPSGARAALTAILLSSAASLGCDPPAAVDAGTDTGPLSDTPITTDTPSLIDAFAEMPDAFTPDDAAPPVTARTNPTQGGAIALSSDDTIAVATNRQANTISVLSVTTGAAPTTTRTALIDVPNAEPWAAVIGNDTS